MPRTARVAPGGMVYHVLNRSVGRMKMFRKPADFDAFARIMIEAKKRFPIRILAYCILSNHWHFVAWPDADGELTHFFRWLTHTHAMRWRVSHHTVGYGHLYQGRFKSFPIEQEDSLLTVCRYVERNALSAGLVKRAELWPHGSLWARTNDDAELRGLLSPCPVQRPSNWVERVNTPLSAREVERMETSVARGRPFGSEAWTRRVVGRLHLEHTMRDEGRPKKAKPKAPDGREQKN